MFVYNSEAKARVREADLDESGYDDVTVESLEYISLKTYSPIMPQTTSIWDDNRTMWLVSGTIDD